jgi:hypothetical protein
MSQANSITAKSANPGSEVSCANGRNELHWRRKVLQVIRAVSPRKPANTFAAWGGVSLRQAQYTLAEKSGMSDATLRNLLLTEHGWEILEAAFDGEQLPGWFLDLRYHHKAQLAADQIAKARAERNALKRRR